MITRAATKYSVFNDIVNTTTYTIKHNNKRKTDATAIQRHKMVWPTSGYYYDGIIGGKTISLNTEYLDAALVIIAMS